MEAAGRLLRIRAAAAALALFAGLGASPAGAIDGIAAEAGRGYRTDVARFALHWNWDRRWLGDESWHVGGYWELALGRWTKRDRVASGVNDELVELALTPVFRLQPNGLKGPYLEAGIGLRLLSHTRIGDRRFGTRLQFGEHVGVGYRFGARGAWEVGYRFQHVSNGRIEQPNDGINFHQVRLRYAFR